MRAHRARDGRRGLPRPPPVLTAPAKVRPPTALRARGASRGIRGSEGAGAGAASARRRRRAGREGGREGGSTSLPPLRHPRRKLTLTQRLTSATTSLRLFRQSWKIYSLIIYTKLLSSMIFSNESSRTRLSAVELRGECSASGSSIHPRSLCCPPPPFLSASRASTSRWSGMRIIIMALVLYTVGAAPRARVSPPRRPCRSGPAPPARTRRAPARAPPPARRPRTRAAPRRPSAPR